MNNYHNLYILGTSHISKQSIDEINQSFDKIKPSILAVELDKQRVHALLSNKKPKGPSFYDIKKIGINGFFFALIGSWASRKLGKIVGVTPGSEMKSAVVLAKKNKVNVALIDQDIRITLKKFSKSFTWKEKWNIFVDIFKGLVLRKKDPLLNFDLSKVPHKKIVRMMISRLEERYPNMYKVLIDERNYYMARKLKKLMADFPDKNILAIVGAGHEEAIMDILRENEGITYSFSVG